VLVYFSDTQFAVPTVYKWAKKNHIGFYPYIGVTESHSTNIIKKTIVDLMFKRNLKIYRNSHCFAKTPTVERKLRELGVNNITVVPVGLDQTLLKSDYQAYLPDELKKKYGYCETDKILLFIGRMIDEKQPLRMIEIFDDIVKSDSNYKLLMVGNGNLMGDVKAEIKKRSLDESVKNIERIPNNDIWELYRIADCFVNLNQQEIFGMAILEAMYYGCKVVAWHAPGPDFIIENGVSGWIVNSNQQVAEKIKDTSYLGENARNRILKELVWDSTAKKIYTSVNENLG
jgi:1,2-diacylglycerol 3-alpha-glucosyltransferase